MRLKRAFAIWLLILTFFSISAQATDLDPFHPQGQTGPQAAALAGASAALPGSAESIFHNPAGLAGVWWPEISAGAGMSSQPTESACGYLAASYPVIGSLVLGIGGQQSAGFTPLQSGLIGLAFPFSHDGKMILGLTAKFLKSDQSAFAGTASGAGFDLGVYYPVWDDHPAMALKFGLALLDAQTVIKDTREEIRLPNRFRTGLVFNMTPNRFLTLEFDSQQSYTRWYESYSVLRAGLEQAWRISPEIRLQLRLGGLKRFDRDAVLTAGLGADYGDWQFAYAVQTPQNLNTAFHQLGLSWGWQKRVRAETRPEGVAPPPTKPLVKETIPEEKASLISALELAAKAEKQTLFAREEAKPTRTPTPEPRREREEEPEEETTYHLPPVVGPADRERVEGISPEMPAFFNAPSRFTAKQSLRIVNQDLRLHVVVNPFSPNKDGRQDKTMFVGSLQSDNYRVARWVLEIVKDSRVVQNFRGGSMLPRNLEWDGKDKKGKTLADGLYHAVLRVFDQHGMELLQSTQAVKIQTKSEVVTMNAPEAVPLTGGPEDKPLEFTLPELKGSSDWQFAILSPSGRRVYERKGSDGVPQTLSWNAKIAGKPAPAGRYRAVVNYRDEIGLQTKTEAGFAVRYASVNASLGAEPELFQPAGRGGAGVRFQPRVEGNIQVKSWSVTIARLDTNATIRVITGEGNPPETVVWDGANEKGEPVPGGGLYSGMLAARLVVGNEAEAESPKLQCDVGAYAGEKALAINLARVHFQAGSSALTEEAGRSLATAIDALLKYKTNYQLQITGHCDKEEAAKENESELTRRRALAVADYMTRKSIPADRIQSVGKGASQPLGREDNEESYAKNRRVEILLYAQ